MLKNRSSSAMQKRRRKSRLPDPANEREFDALSDADKGKLYSYFDTHKKLTGLRKPTKAEQRTIDTEVDAEIRKRGRPVVGEGSTQIAVTIETGLLRRVDEYVKRNRIKRAQLIARALRKILEPRKSA